jgi:hypothetical protein
MLYVSYIHIHTVYVIILIVYAYSLGIWILYLQCLYGKCMYKSLWWLIDQGHFSR